MRPFSKLRGEITAHELEHSDFARGIGLSKSAVSQRLNGHKQWRLSEMYAAMDLLKLDHSKMNEYFPPFEQKPRSVQT